MFIFPHWHAWHHIGCIQHTLPLLFDDCLTILEKLDALWCKLNDLITDYDEFKSDFETWKGEVEDTLDSIIDELGKLDARVDTLEADMASVKASIANLTTIVNNLANTVNSMDSRLTTLEGEMATVRDGLNGLNASVGDLADRVAALEDTLSRLNIVVPEELFKENDIDWFIQNVSTPWLTQMGLSSATYVPQRKIIPVATDIGTIPAVSFKVGVLGFPIVQAKIPLMYAFTPANTNIVDVDSFYKYASVDTNVNEFVRAVQQKATTADAFAPITLYHAPSFMPADNIKFTGSYALFAQPGSTSLSIGVDMSEDRLGTMSYRGTFTSDCTVSVRVALTQNSTSAHLAVAVDKICFYYCTIDSKIYAMLLSEHQ